MQREPHSSRDIAELVRLECRVFAAKIRMARALLGWSQSELANRVGLTQRGIHKLEQGETEPRRATVRAVEAVWQDEGIEFHETADGGFRITVRAALIERSHTTPDRGAPSVVPRARAFNA